MAVSVGELEATFRLRDELTPQLRIAERQIDDVKESLEAVDTQLGRFNGTAKGTAQAAGQAAEKTDDFGSSMVMLGQAAAAFSFAHGVTSALEFASKLTDLSAATGVSTADLQRINVVAAESGISLEQAARGIQLAQRNVAEGSDKVKETIAGLGLNVEALLAMDPATMFFTIGDAVSKVENPTQRTADAMAILGRSGANLIPLLDNVQKIKAEVPIMAADSINSLDFFDDAWGRLKIGTVSALGEVLASFTSIDGALALLTTNVMGGQGAALTENRRKWGEWRADVAGVIADARGTVAWLAEQTGQYMSEGVAAMREFLGSARTWLNDRFSDVSTMAVGFITRIPAALLTMKNQGVAYAQQLYTGVRSWLVDQFNAVVESIRAKVSAVTGFFKDMYMAVVGGSFVPDMLDGIRDQFARLPEGMVTPAEMATGTVTGFFSGMASSVTKTLGDGFSDWLSRSSTFKDDFAGVWGILASNFGGLVEGMGKQLSSFISGGRLSMASFLTDMGNFASQINGDLTNTIFSEWLKAALGEHWRYGGGEEDERRRREESERYFPTTPGYEPPSNEGTGNPYPFANGGVVTRPTLGLVGEAGPEAIIPLKQWGGMGGSTVIHVDARGAFFNDDRSMRRFADLLVKHIPGAVVRTA